METKTTISKMEKQQAKMETMKKLQIAIANHNEVVFMEKEIDFIPSKGLMIREPIYGTIDAVLFDKDGYTAQLESVLTPSDPENQIKYLKNEGWVEIKIKP